MKHQRGQDNGVLVLAPGTRAERAAIGEVMPKFAVALLLLFDSAPTCLFRAPAEKAADQLTLAVVPGTKSLYAGDVLLLKSTVTNKGKTPVSLDRPLTTSWGGISFEMCPPNETAFTPILLPGQGLLCGIGKPRIPHGESLVDFEQFVWDFPLDPQVKATAPGVWKVRAVVVVGGDKLVSEPVAIKVIASEGRLKQAIQGRTELISRMCRSGLSDSDRNEVRTAQQQLAGTNAARVISRACALDALRSASSTKARQLAWEDVRKGRAELDPVERELFDFATVGTLRDRKEYADALKLLDTIPPSATRDDLIALVKAYSENQGK